MRELNGNEVQAVNGGSGFFDGSLRNENIRMVALIKEDWTYERYDNAYGQGEVLKLEQSIEVAYEGAAW